MSDVDFEVPERAVIHDEDDDSDFTGHDLGRGEITTLPMNPTAKAAARRRRERVDQLGGFGFGGAA